jgi:LAO/AO transport system kinase
MSDWESLAQGIVEGKRRAIAKAITLIESERSDDRLQAEALLCKLMPKTGKSIRIGVSGSPGVGKSTFIESFGKLLLKQKKQLAILAVDPSSPVTGGSILGDKTRMEELVKSEHVFIRPSPSKGTLGGVSRRTREAIIICEAAGFDFIFVETVGVGQSEVTVASMVDIFLMLQLPNAGDELQGIKKGILEKADIVVVTKADGTQKNLAERTRLEQQRALHLVRSPSSWQPPVIVTSAVENSGFEEVYAAITACHSHKENSGDLLRDRSNQAQMWFEQELSEGVRDWLKQQSILRKRLIELETDVVNLRRPASSAARELFSLLSAHA